MDNIDSFESLLSFFEEIAAWLKGGVVDDKVGFNRSLVLYAVIESQYFNGLMGYPQPLLVLTYERDWEQHKWTGDFPDVVYSALDGFGLTEYIDDVFEPLCGPMTKRDLEYVARSLGFKHEKQLGEKYCELDIT